jgi:hypothetical protein
LLAAHAFLEICPPDLFVSLFIRRHIDRLFQKPFHELDGIQEFGFGSEGGEPELSKDDQLYIQSGRFHPQAYCERHPKFPVVPG